MVCVTYFEWPKIWVTCSARSRFFFWIYCRDRCIVGIYLFCYNPILTLSVSLHGQVLSQNYWTFFICDTLKVIFLTPITSELIVFYESISQSQSKTPELFVLL